MTDDYRFADAARCGTDTEEVRLRLEAEALACCRGEAAPRAASRRLSELTARFPGRPQYHSWLGSHLVAIGDFDGGIDALRVAVYLAPDDADALCSLGAAFARRADALGGDGGEDDPLRPAEEAALTEAARHLYRALAAGPPSAKAAHKANSFLGYALGRLGRVAEAAEAYQRAADAKPEDRDSWCALGMALRLSGRPWDAAQALRRALALPAAPLCPANATRGALHALVAECLVDCGSFDRALDHAHLAAEFEPDSDAARAALDRARRAAAR